MFYNLHFDLGAFVILTVLLISIHMRGMTKGKVNQYFLTLLTTVLLATVSDLISVCLDNLDMGGLLNVKYVAHSVYLVMHNLTTPVLIAYIFVLADTWHLMRRKKHIWIMLATPIIVVLGLMIVNPFNGIVFYFDEQDAYTRGPAFFVLYVAAIAYFLMSMHFLFAFKKYIKNEQFWAIFIMYPLMMLAVVVQFFRPGMLVEMFTNAIGLLIAAFVVTKPEDLVDQKSGALKDTTYFRDINRDFQTGKHIRMVFVTITNFQAIKKITSYEERADMLHKSTTELLNLIAKHKVDAEVYYIGRGRFRVVINREKGNDGDALVEDIFAFTRKPVIIGGVEINLLYVVCQADCPEDIEDAESLTIFGSDLTADHYTDHILYAKDIYDKEKYKLRLEMDQIVEHALAHQKFEVYYQPIYSVKEERFNSAEALLRLKDEQYGFISPEIFIPAAEKSGAIHQIGTFVLEEVCKFIKSDEFKELGLDYIEVNLSVAQCMRPSLADEVVRIMDKYGVSTEQINLEITETAASVSQATLEENLAILTKHGVTFSLDDFGTGYSNMQRIASLPLAIVKLDRSFTQLEDNPNLRIILQNTIRMIKDMDMKIVIEGVETKDMVEAFTDLSCDYIQGFYFSRPVTKEDFVKFVREATK